MSSFSKNKSLYLLVAIAFLYIILTFFIIQPLIEENNKLEDKKTNILTNKNNKEYTSTFNKNKKENVADKNDIALLIKEKIGDKVDIRYIQKKEDSYEGNKSMILEVGISSELEKIFELEDELENLKLKDSLYNMTIENSSVENSKKSKNIFDCIMTFKVN